MAEPSIKALLASSRLAFSGVVQAVSQSTVAGLPADERTVIVRVDQPLHAPPEVDLSAGSQVTVQLSDDLSALGPGDRATFFANPAAYGDTLAVSEVGRVTEPSATAGARLGTVEEPASAVDEALAELDQDAVVEHARQADLIVRARVVRLEEARTPQAPHEHDPHWWIATLEADLVVTGDAPGLGDGGGTVRVLYANSIDVTWRRWPKPKAGQGGLWLLHNTPDDLAQLAPLQMAHEEDLQPSVQIDVLRENGIGGDR